MKANDLIATSTSLPQSDVAYLLCVLYGCNPAELPIFKENDLSSEQTEKLQSWLQRLKDGEPPQYIAEQAWFYGYEFVVNSSVLIPRYDTEVLVDAVLKRVGDNDCILDIGTGSGCIAITLKKQRPSLNVYATDISALALEVAKLNAARNGVEVSFFLADLVPDELSIQFDLIISNPPYISPQEFSELDGRVKAWEPKLALLAEDDGLSIFKRIIFYACVHLKPGGILALEHGYNQRNSLVSLTKNQGFELLECGCDLAEKDRYLILQKLTLEE